MRIAYIIAMALLDNPLWSSLTTLHAPLAIRAGEAARYPADVAPFVAVAGDGVAAAALGELVQPGETVYFVGPRPAGLAVEELGNILQMVCDAPGTAPDSAPDAPAPDSPAPDAPAIVELGAAHHADVLALAALVYPHYFRPRTPALGRYFGIYDGARLAAMIGERMGMPGFREISAVCTHPDFVGRGLARRLLAFLGNDIARAGATPFLHVSPGNARAVQLYAQNGYRLRREIPFAALRR
jgi:ribosomal protein S18 acetylase RimI-like enzyme